MLKKALNLKIRNTNILFKMERYWVNSNNGDYITHNDIYPVGHQFHGYILHLIRGKVEIDGVEVEMRTMKLDEFQFQNVKGFLPIKRKKFKTKVGTQKNNINCLTKVIGTIEKRNFLINDILKK